MKYIKTPNGSQTLAIGTSSVTFDLFYSRRKTLSIRVHPNQSVEVNVPFGTGQAAIEDFVRRRGDWVLGHLNYFKQHVQPEALTPHQYVGGEWFRYLGNQYQLNVVQDSKERVILSGDCLTVCVRHTADSKRVKSLVLHWYRSHAQRVFAERLAACFPSVEPLGVAFPPLKIRAMKRRWGSCSMKGVITLNLKLIQAPLTLIDYVIMHELCHLKEHNHGSGFWALMHQTLPGWEHLRAQLRLYESGEI